jgi:hypothetical protein
MTTVLLTFNLNFDFSGLAASVTGFFMMLGGFICFLISFIVGLVIKTQENISFSQQRSGAFIWGGLLQLLFGALLMLSVWDDFADRSFRRTMDSVTFFYALFAIIITIIVIMMRLGKIKKA